MIVEIIALSVLAVARDKYPEATDRVVNGILVGTAWTLRAGASTALSIVGVLSKLGREDTPPR